ncbi:MAG: discoidin domain-containing protein, partial [Lentisphaerota bacterium]
MVTASGVQESLYPAQNACDGKIDTRWSGPATDPQWLQIDLGRLSTVCGITILWETAYAVEYDIKTSLDGREWKTVYSKKDADGHTDYVTFSPVEAQFLRIVGLKRATGWGHSIWEVDVHGPSEQIKGLSGSHSERLFDGCRETSWVSEEKGSTQVKIDLGRALSFGGLRIDWGEYFAEQVDVFASTNGVEWGRLGELRDGTGGLDVLLLPQTTARYVRLDMKTPEPGQPVEIREISLRGPDEVVTPLALYQLAAEKARPGLYPDWLRRRQVYWTVLGLPDDSRESLFDEYGNLEPQKGGGSVMPYVFSTGRLLSAFDAAAVTQSLACGFMPLPAVEWRLKDLSLRIEACAGDAPASSSAYVRYALSNVSGRIQSGRFYLAIRPLQINPPWQYAGLSSADSMEFSDTGGVAVARVNGKVFLASLTAPDGFGARTFERGDVARELEKNLLPSARKAESAGGLISGALAYDYALAPGECKVVEIVAPMHETITGAWTHSFEQAWSVARDSWSNQLGHVVFEVSDRDITDFLKAQMAYMLIHRDGAALQPGSRQYERSWIRDGAMMSEALMRMGLFQPVREFIDWYAHFIQPNGMVPPSFRHDDALDCGPGSGLEYDGQGAWVYLVMEYYRFTGDRAFLEKHFESMHKSLGYLEELRGRTLVEGYMTTNPPSDRFVGILPKSFSHEGYDLPMHSYWDDFWALKGWKDGREAASILGREDVAAWAEGQYEALRTSVVKSVELTMKAKDIDYVPGCAEKGDFDPTSSSIAVVPCGERALVPETVWQATYDRYFKEIEARLQPGWCAGFTPYESRNVSSLVEIGQKDRAIFLLDYLLGFRQ